ncbi:MAG: DUF126 domain-containing protein [Methanoculleaceae archaeon]
MVSCRIIRGRGISGGKGTGPLLWSPEPISFLGGVNPETGEIIEEGQPLQGRCIAGTVFAFPHGKGSTVGSYVIYALKQNGVAPAAMVAREAEPIIATGAIMAKIPLIDHLEIDPASIPGGTTVTVDGREGVLICHTLQDD